VGTGFWVCKPVVVVSGHPQLMVTRLRDLPFWLVFSFSTREVSPVLGRHFDTKEHSSLIPKATCSTLVLPPRCVACFLCYAFALVLALMTRRGCPQVLPFAFSPALPGTQARCAMRQRDQRRAHAHPPSDDKHVPLSLCVAMPWAAAVGLPACVLPVKGPRPKWPIDLD